MVGKKKDFAHPTFDLLSTESVRIRKMGSKNILSCFYTAHWHNLNFYVGWARSFSCPPTS